MLGLPAKTVRILVNLLESYSARGFDWRGLAECVGFTTTQIQAIETAHGDSFTWRVFSAWDRSNKSSVKKLIIALILIERIDCVKELGKSLNLNGEDLKGLYQIAAQLGRNDDERSAMFPPFGEGDLDIFPEVASHLSSLLSRPIASSHLPTWECDAPCQKSASSPNEEHPPPSYTQSEATDISLSKNAAFISYYPDHYTQSQIGLLAHKLREYGFDVDYASGRQMMDVDFKVTATQKAYNLIVLCSPKYYDEDRRLLTQAQNPSPSAYAKPSMIAIDHKLLRRIYFKPGEDKRIVCVVLDQGGERCIHHVPDIYHGRPIHRFPSETMDLLQLLADVPKYSAPPPTPRLPITSKKIDYPNALREWNAQVPRNVNEYFHSQRSEPVYGVPEQVAHPNRMWARYRSKEAGKTSFFRKILKK